MIRAGEECACVVLLLVALLFSACGSTEALDAARVQELVPLATAVPTAELDELAQRGEQASIISFESRTLSVVFMFAQFRSREDFRPVPPTCGEWAGDPFLIYSGEHATCLPSECLRVIEIVNEGDRACGSFRFHRAGRFEGFVEFEAERRDGDWTLTRFRLPLTDLETRLRANGTWRSNLPDEQWLDERDRVRALPHEQRLSVRVVDLQGNPVPDAGIQLEATGLDVKRETTDAEGRATFPDLPAIECSVWVWRHGRVGPHPHLVLPAKQRAMPSSGELVLAYRAGVPLRGRALDAEGRGVAGAVVQIASGGTRVDRVGTDAEGRWSGSGLADAEHVIDIYSQDRGAGAWKAVLEGVRPSAEEIVVRLERAR